MKRLSHWVLTICLLSGVCLQTVKARELAVPIEDMLPVELATIGVVPMTGTPVVLLREPQGGDIVPIFIGPNEARAIILAQRGIEPERPMTHDLLVSLMTAMGGELQRVVVDELRQGTYHGALEISLPGRDDPVRIDSRPSDALAMAVRTGATILVAPSVLAAGRDIPFEGLGDDDLVTALGISVMAASSELRQALELPDQPGVLVSAVQGLAEAAGIQPGSLIVEVNGRPPLTPLAFLELVSATESGEPARLRFWHDGEFRQIELDTDVAGSAPRAQQRRGI
jgi:uncharacterized protein